MKAKKFLASFLVLAFWVSCITTTQLPVMANSAGIQVSFDLSKAGKPIADKFSVLNAWNLNSSWTGAADNQPMDYLSSDYPFLNSVQLMTATGGSKDRDLFVNPDDRGTMTDYKFDTLIDACRNVLKQGLKPYIVTGNVPIKFSSNPSAAGFGVNVRPPDDFNQYYMYIKSVADALVSAFGLGEVSTWTWGVLTEYENPDWFVTADWSPTNSENAYFKLYDYTVAALQASLGASNITACAEPQLHSYIKQTNKVMPLLHYKL